MIEHRLAHKVEITLQRRSCIGRDERNLEFAPANGLARPRDFINDLECATFFEFRQAFAEGCTEQFVGRPSSRDTNRELIYVGAPQLGTAQKRNRSGSMFQQFTQFWSLRMGPGVRGVSSPLVSDR